MKRFLMVVMFFLVTAVFVPILVFYFVNISINNNDLKYSPSNNNEIKVFFHNENIVKAMNIEEYLCGVVAAEMPATFKDEALKAQAVAARSYAYYRKNYPTEAHQGADVCTDYTHCKAYRTEDECMNSWGDDGKEYMEKIKNAVFSTEGEILTYDGEVAMAVFHSQSGGGRTENSEDVWGGEVPYLVSVESYGEETAPNFYSTVRISF